MKNVTFALFSLLLLFTLVGLFPLAAFADTLEDVPLFSLKRASLAVGADYSAVEGSALLSHTHETKVGVFLAYKLTPKNRLGLVGSVKRGLKSETTEWNGGLRLRLWSGAGE